MDASVIRTITFGIAFMVFVAYVIFVSWRVRVHRRRRAAEEAGPTSSTMSSDAMLQRSAAPPQRTPGTATDQSPTVTDGDPPKNADAAKPSPPLRGAEADGPAHQPATVLEAVQGISLPHDLVPHPDATARPGAVDRVALIGSMVEFETLRDGVDEALNAIGYEVIWDDSEGMARNGRAELRVNIYASARTAVFEGVAAFPLAGDGAVVVDFWIAADS